MKVLHLSTYDNHGGAAIAANLLHQALKAKPDMTSQMLVCYKNSNDPDVIAAYNGSFEKKIRSFRYKTELRICKRPTLKYGETFSTGLIPFSLIRSKIKKINPDILHIHWAQFGFLNLRDLVNLEVPIVWTLHDLWPISDGIHYFDSDQLNRSEHKFLYYQKKNIYRKAKIDFVAVSKWVMSMLENSELAGNCNKHFISNGIDCEAFVPVEKIIAKRALKIDPDKKVLLFGAVSPFSSKRKGFYLLTEALKNIDPEKIQLIVFGDDEQELRIGNHTGTCVGKISNRKILSLIYSAADAMVVPSLYETFGLTAAEAMACCTPVVSFQTSGLCDIIDHKHNGYLAKAYDPSDLATGIEWILDYPLPGDLQHAARKKILDQFNIHSIVAKHLELYKNLINNKLNDRDQIS